MTRETTITVNGTDYDLTITENLVVVRERGVKVAEEGISVFGTLLHTDTSSLWESDDFTRAVEAAI